MKIIPDTHALVWALVSPQLLSAPARRAFDSGTVIVSVVSLWELILKQKRRGALVQDPVRWWRRQVEGRFDVLGVNADHVVETSYFPGVHGDPFDRMLAAQTVVEGASLISRDGLMDSYPVKVIW